MKAESLENRPTVRILGPTHIQVGHERTHIRGTKQRILLSHMVLSNGRPVPISRLVNDLWTGASPRNAPHALQEHVSRLRTALQVDIELLAGAGYRLAADQIVSDTSHFAQLCDRGQRQLKDGDPEGAVITLEEAMALWRGPLLDDLADVDGLRAHKLQLEEMWRQATSHRIDAYIACDRGPEVLAEIKTFLDADPLRDYSWYQLIQALDQGGQRNEALQAFHDARELFIDVLGVEPSARLGQLHTSILRAIDDAPEATEPTTPTTAPDHETRASSLVGRRHELSVLEQVWQESAAGLQVVTISGEPGVGKSRLATEFARSVAARGALVLGGHCQQGITVPYQPFAQMLQGSIDFAQHANIATRTARHAAGLTRVLPEIAALFPPTPAEDNALRTRTDDSQPMDALAAWLEALSHARPVIIVLEDLQWADEQSVLLLHHLIRSTRTIKGTVIATVRDHQVSDNKTGSAALGRLLEQSHRVTHVALATLPQDETRQLVDAEMANAGADSLPPWADSYIQAASGGNPLYTIELTRHLLAAGPFPDGAVPKPPASLRQVIKGHLSSLDERASALLRHAAAFGTEFNPAHVTTVCDASAADVDAMLQAATRARLIKPALDHAHHYAFSHDVVRAVLYESIPPLMRSQLHTKIAQSLVSSGAASGSQHLQELARHHQLSDLPDANVRAAQNLSDAGYQALDAGAPAEAVALLTAAIELLGNTADAGVTCDTLVGLGAAQLRCAQPEYRATLLRAARVAMDMGDSERLITAVLMNSRGWWSSSGHVDHERVEGIETALAACDPANQAAMAQLLAAWAEENVVDPGSRGMVLDRSAQALAIADTLGDPDVLYAALDTRFTVMYALFENPAECVTLSRRLLEFAQSRGNRMMVLSGLLCLAQASMRFGDYQVADRSVEHAHQLATALQHPPRLWLVSGWRAMREAARGRFESAQALAAETLELGTRTGQSDAPTWHMGQVFTFNLMQHTLPEILSQVGEQVAGVADVIPGWRAAMAVALTQAGRAADAEAILEEFAAGDFEQLPQDILWLNGMCYLSMTCVAVARQDIAADLYEQLAPYSGMVATNATIDAGPVDLHLGALARVLGNTEGAHAHLQAAMLLSRKIGATVWLTEAKAQLAQVESAATRL